CKNVGRSIYKYQKQNASCGSFHLPKTSTTKLFGTMTGRDDAAVGLNSAAGKNSLCVFRSNAIVFEPVRVLIVSTAVYLSGASWRMTDTVPSPHELKTSFNSGSNELASTRSPMGTVATIFPLSEFMTKRALLRQPTNRRWLRASIAMLTGVLAGAIGQRSSTLS